MNDLDKVLTGADAGSTTTPDTTTEGGGDAATGDDAGTIARQRARLDKIEGLVGNVREFADKVADVPSQKWGGDLRDALAQIDSALGEARTALDTAPADYKHPRKGGKASMGAGDKVQIAESFRDEYKGLLGDVEFGTTAVADVKSVDDKSRATLWFDGGKVRVLITTRKLVHAGGAGTAS